MMINLQARIADYVMSVQTQRTTRQHNRSSSRMFVLAVMYGSALLMLSLTIWANLRADVPFSFFSRDPMATFNGHPLTGMQSTLGVLVWCAAAGFCFFSYAVLRDISEDTLLPPFLFWAGVISSLLALDDMFLIHEDLAYRYLSLNEKVVFLGYGALMLWWLFRFRKQIFSTEYFLLIVALAFFGGSSIVDLMQSRLSSPFRIFFEDGFKLLGIVSWSGYLMGTCFCAVTARLNQRRDPVFQTTNI